MGQYFAGLAIPTINIVRDKNGVTSFQEHIQEPLKDFSEEELAEICSVLDVPGHRKLTEHSWLGNNEVNSMVRLITNNTMRIAWIGDYAEFEPTGATGSYGHGFVRSADEFAVFYNLAQNPYNSVQPVEPLHEDDPLLSEDGPQDGYLVNLSSGEYVNMERFVKACRDSEGWCLHPLPLLTAVGNGKGGGDYFGEVGCDYVGAWAFDRICYTVTAPAGLNEIHPVFRQ